MFDISVIIVNYNVKHFLNQCLQSVLRASKELQVEIIVVDNNSVDGSEAMVKKEFPTVRFIAKKSNDGFSVANNEGIRLSAGKYTLLLNPDTIVQEDTLISCFNFMESHPNAGALGVKMIDGAGKFLPESKRGFPNLWTSFCKLSGLSSLFKKSKRLNRYYLGHIDENEIAQIDVLCGAFMFMRKSVLDHVGLLDENFFMYGEDIDLSYRIKKAGFDVVYFPETRIIHYKGESTKKGSVNYIHNFYDAMIIFTKKHFSSGSSRMYVGFVKVAIYLRALLSILKRIVTRIIHPVFDFLVVFSGLNFFKNLWATKYHLNPAYYDNSSITANLAFYAIAWILGMYIFGNYDKRTNLFSLLRGLIISSIFVLIFYAILPLEYRPSRFLLLVGTCWALICTMFSKLIFNYVETKKFSFVKPLRKRIAIVGLEPDTEQIKQLLKGYKEEQEVVGVIHPAESTADSYYINSISNLEEVVEILNITELIFSAKALNFSTILQLMSDLGSQLTYKIADEENYAVLGSDSKNTPGELYTYDFQLNIAKASNVRIKKLSNVVLTLLIFFLSPLIFVFSGFNAKIFRNLFVVLTGKKQWVSYDYNDLQVDNLPSQKPGIIPVSIQLGKKELRNAELHNINTYYANNYRMFQDTEILIKFILRYYRASQ